MGLCMYRKTSAQKPLGQIAKLNRQTKDNLLEWFLSIRQDGYKGYMYKLYILFFKTDEVGLKWSEITMRMAEFITMFKTIIMLYIRWVSSHGIIRTDTFIPYCIINLQYKPIKSRTKIQKQYSPENKCLLLLSTYNQHLVLNKRIRLVLKSNNSLGRMEFTVPLQLQRDSISNNSKTI